MDFYFQVNKHKNNILKWKILENCYIHLPFYNCCAVLFDGGKLRVDGHDGVHIGQRRHLSDHRGEGAEAGQRAGRAVADALMRHVRLLRPVRFQSGSAGQVGRVRRHASRRAQRHGALHMVTAA